MRTICGAQSSCVPTASLWRPYGLSVRKAVETLLPELKALEHGLGFGEAVERLLVSKRAAGVSERYLYCIADRLNRFAAAFPGRSLASFALRDVEQRLNGQLMGAQSVNP